MGKATSTSSDSSTLRTSVTSAAAGVGSSPKVGTQGADEIYFSYCDMCNHVPKCGLKVYVRDGVVTHVETRGDYPNDPPCSKGLSILQEQYHPDRLKYPLKRSKPKGSGESGWVRISWDEALETIAKKLLDIRARDGADKVLFMTGDPKEMRGPLERLAFTFGSPNYGTESSACFRGAQLAALLTWGLTSLGFPPTAASKTCLIWSQNPAWSGAYDMWKLLDWKEKGLKFVVVDPRLTPTVEHLADVHLQLRPGTDGALALGMMNVAIEEGLWDEEFVDKWVEGFDELRDYVKDFSPSKVEEITWVPAEKIVQAARLVATNKPCTWIGSASPTTHSSNGLQNHRGILALISITGNFDIQGGVEIPTYPLPFDPFTASPVFERFDLMPKLADKRADREYYPVWAEKIDEIQVNRLPEYVKAGKLKAAVLFGVNAMMWPQSHEYQEALKNLEFGVAVDYFERPQTHRYVDMLLPAATTFERTAPLAVFNRSIYLREPVVKPLGECRPDWDIIFQLGVKLGYADEFWKGSVEAGLNSLLQPLNLTVDDLRKSPGKCITVPPPGPNKYRKYELGLFRPDQKPGFNTPTGKVELASSALAKHGFDPLPTYKEPLESPVSTPGLAEKYPLILNTGSRVHLYTHSKLRDIPWLRELMPDPIVRVSPQDAAKRGIKEGDPVLLETPLGNRKFTVQVTNLVMPGVIDCFHGWEMANVNELIGRTFDPISGFPAYKEGLCEIRKA